MRYLKHYSNAVADLTGGVLSGAVLKLFYYFKGIVDNSMAFYSLDADDCAYTAGVMLKGLSGTVPFVPYPLRFPRLSCL